MQQNTAICHGHQLESRPITTLVYVTNTARAKTCGLDVSLVCILVGDLTLLTFSHGCTTLQIARDGSGAKVLKSAVVKTPLSVYEATAGRELYRPVQTSPIPNFFLAGCFTKQKYLASMEGATFSGKLAARALADAAMAGTVCSATRKPAVAKGFRALRKRQVALL